MTKEFYRIKRLPPYVLAEVNAMKAEARAAGRDIIIENTDSEVTIIGGGLGDDSAQRGIGVISASPRTTVLKHR